MAIMLYLPSQIREIMSLYAVELKNREINGLPRQMILFGSQWTEGVESFIQYMQEPMIVIDQKLEAAVYGKVKWVSQV